MEVILKVLLGVSWKTSLLGLAIGLATAAVTYAQTRSEPLWYLVALGFAAIGRFAADAKAKIEAPPAPAPAPPPTP